MLRRLIVGIVVEAGFVGHLCANVKNRGGIICNATIVEWQSYGAFECTANRMAMRKFPPSWSKGISIKIGRRRSLSIGFPLGGGGT